VYRCYCEDTGVEIAAKVIEIHPNLTEKVYSTTDVLTFNLLLTGACIVGKRSHYIETSAT